jgi:hypothetical protein
VTSDRRDSSGTTTRTGILTQDRYQALGRQLGILLPLGTHLDLVGELRTRKGISFNFVTISYAAGESRLEYLLSQLDEAEGNPTARAVVNLLKSIDLI